MVFSMINIIKYFEEECISKFEELERNFMLNPTNIAEFVYGITSEVHKLGLEMMKVSLESMDEMLQKSALRKEKWVVESHAMKTLTTSLGDVCFSKTLFTSKETGTSEYLLDRIIGLERNERMTEDAEANLLAEAVQTSYRRGGELASLETDLSKQTVKNKIHALKFPQNEEKPEEKKQVDYLYIDADEDHISLQFKEKKGDLIENDNHQKNNCLIAKLVYVYEGIVNESPCSDRHCLVNPYYFSDINSGEENLRFWDEIYEYIDNHYDIKNIKKIYINSDGGAWIKSGMKRIAGIIHVLDEFHLEKYIKKLTAHMKDSCEDAEKEVRKTIRKEGKDDFKNVVARLESCLPDGAANKKIKEAERYILSNWSAAKTRLRYKEHIVGSSTEGHVSHVLSSRMSSRPMGWSKTGAKNMVRLRAYDLNGGDMLELVRYQKQEIPKVSGDEYNVLSCEDILLSERNQHKEIGKYFESIKHSMSEHNSKIVYFNAHIWGL